MNTDEIPLAIVLVCFPLQILVFIGLWRTSGPLPEPRDVRRFRRRQRWVARWARWRRSWRLWV